MAPGRCSRDSFKFPTMRGWLVPPEMALPDFVLRMHETVDLFPSGILRTFLVAQVPGFNRDWPMSYQLESPYPIRARREWDKEGVMETIYEDLYRRFSDGTR